MTADVVESVAHSPVGSWGELTDAAARGSRIARTSVVGEAWYGLADGLVLLADVRARASGAGATLVATTGVPAFLAGLRLRLWERRHEQCCGRRSSADRPRIAPPRGHSWRTLPRGDRASRRRESESPGAELDAIVFGSGPDLLQGVRNAYLPELVPLLGSDKPMLRIHTGGATGGSIYSRLVPSSWLPATPARCSSSASEKASEPVDVQAVLNTMWNPLLEEADRPERDQR